ncbi:heterogeneous nuclear ribonucleoprotein H2 isoform X2 [Ixodes scapularis]|uniref:Putative splicing factor hnrnp-f n=1 Tax=Ixodes ricinus TaxID=34613 RepID=A0A131XXI3_IXORI|nr:heterogeneous nuclear ribonucleoprotein H2 isoform X2 [Ixodes scapularis]XP_040358004.1 heterogeneous nuclear ribonucleoprotein H2 isoform X2 [Ixodes scapularis]
MATPVDDEGFVLRIRGLPWSTTKEEILNFFTSKEVNIKGGISGVHMTLSREGRPSGEAYIELESEQDVEVGLQRHNEHIGHRYIEVFKSKRSEMDWVVKRSGAHQQDSLNDGCVRLRGLPFGCSKEEIAQFFSGLEIVPNGITLPTDYQGRSTGEAFVQFATRDIAEKAMGKHKEKIGHRYIEIFKSSLQEIRSAVGMGVPKMMRPLGTARPGPYDRGDRFGGPSRYGMGRGGRNFRGFVEEDGYGDFGGSGGARYSATGHFVHMRGLPFRATERDIFEFFQPMNPMNVHLIYEDSGRPSGECDVEFATHEEAVKAMSKDKAHMQHRYIELFLNSTPSGMSAGGSNGGGAGFGNGVGPIGSGAGTTAFGGTMAGGGSGFGSSSFGGSYGGGSMGGNMIGGNNYTSF